MKKIALCLSIIMLLGAMSGCSGSSPAPAGNEEAATTAPENGEATSAPSDNAATGDGGEIKIGVVNQTLKEAVYRDMQAGAVEKAEELGVTMEWQSCELDSQKQMDIINSYITRDFDVIVIEPVSPDSSAEMGDMCARANIPVVDLEALITSDTKPSVRITGDFKEIGRAKVREFLKDFGTGPANMVVLCGTMGDSVATDLNDGYEEILKDNPQINVIQREWHPNWDRQLAMNTMQNVLSRGDKVDVVIANNDGMGVGAVRAAEEVGLQDQILFYAMDHDEDAVVEMLAGVHYKTVDKTSKLQGARCVEAAFAIANGEEPQSDEVVDGIPTWYTPFTFVSPDNLDVAKTKFPDLFK